MYRKLLFLSFILFFSYSGLFCQQTYSNAEALYQAALSDQKVLYNGYEHNRVKGYLKGHPYFEYNFNKGSVNYDGEFFSDVPLLYDIYMDELILEIRDIHFTRIELQLFKERIKNFEINGHYFIQVSPDTLGGNFKPGFYEVLYDGNVKLFEKHYKNRSEQIDEMERRAYTVFTLKKDFVLYHNGQYFLIRNKSAALKVLKERKKEILKYYRNSGLKFRKDTEKVLTGFLKVYDNLVETNEQVF